MNDLRIFFGGALKALGNDEYGGYLVRFTGPDRRDLHGEYFSAKTDFCLTDYPLRDAKVLYQHGMDRAIGIRTVGDTVRDEIRADGIYSVTKLNFAARYAKALQALGDPETWKRQQLAYAEEYEDYLREWLNYGKMSFSSGALPQSVVVSEDGEILRWAVIDKTYTMTPAEPELTGIQTLKSFAAWLEQQGVESGEDALRPGEAFEPLKAAALIYPNKRTKKSTQRGVDMDFMQKLREMLMGIIGALDEYSVPAAEVDAAAQAMANDIPEAQREGMTEEELMLAVEKAAQALIQKTVQAELAKRDRQKSAAQQAVTAAKQAHAARQANGQSAREQAGGYGGNGGAGRVSVGEELKYARLSASDMALGIKMLMTGIPAPMRQHIRLDQIVSEGYLRSFVHKARKFADSEPFKEYRPNSPRDMQPWKSDHGANMAIKASVPFKADELDASDLAGQGLEWVSEFWDTEVWRRERFPRVYDTLAAKGMWVKEVPQGADTAHFPTEGSDPVVYGAPQANSLDVTGRPEVTALISPFGTGEVQVTPGELKCATSVTVILEEDAIVNIVNQVNYQINEKMMETRDQFILNADSRTAANTNINLIDGTPAGGLQTPYYIKGDGFRKLALTTAGRTLDANNTLTLEIYRLTLALLPAVLRQFKERMLFIIDTDTETASLAIPQIATDDVRRTNATIESGRILNLYGVDVFPSGFLPLTNAAGMVSATAGNNTRGSILLPYAPYWGFAYKRNITVETGREILSGANIWVASMRIGVVPRSNDAVVETFNVAV